MIYSNNQEYDNNNRVPVQGAFYCCTAKEKAFYNVFREQDKIFVAKYPYEQITDDIVKKVPRAGFEITYLSYFFDLFDQLAGKKYAVLKYILQHKSAENTLIITNRELAKKCSVSTKTVVDTLKLLRDAGLIQTRTGAIMLNPKLAHRGSDQKEKYLLQKFVEFPEDEE